MTDDVRPFFGEQSEVVGEWALHWTHVSEPARGPVGDYLDKRIAQFTADGVCAMCMRDLDETGVCGTCGFNPALPRVPEWTPEQQDDYAVRLSQLSIVDEYAPAAVDADAA